jgi:hypothetical protein
VEYRRFNDKWNADPNAPEPFLKVNGTNLVLEFFLNFRLDDQFKEGEKGTLVFYNCHKYSFTTMNDEGYLLGKHRYKNADLPWGNFYLLRTDTEKEFDINAIVVNPKIGTRGLLHYIFFFKDNTFECLSEFYSFSKNDSFKNFQLNKAELWEIVNDPNHPDKLIDWVNNLSKGGVSKQKIYDILNLLFCDIQTRPDPGDVLYDRVGDFLDCFHSYGYGFHILPDEGEVKDF